MDIEKVIEGEEAEEINNEVRRMVFRDKVPLRSEAWVTGDALKRAVERTLRGINGKAE